ncbi:MAG: hypothetical protein K2H20_01750, partial [Bacilli bacterium]|nr:hypothetical protein [Bacilli bacterium]
YYPIVDGKIKIELIDNPYSARPTGYGFNGWVCDTKSDGGVPCEDLTFSYDDDYYLRYVTMDVSEGTENLVINLKASWTIAKVETYTSGTGTTLSNKLYAKGMRKIESAFNNEDSLTGYYYLTSYSGENPELYYNNKGISCTIAECGGSAYKLIQGNDSEDIRLWNYTSSVNDYYYMVTRDTNIVVLSNVNFTHSYFKQMSKPFTITGAYDDREYNPSNGGSISIEGNNYRLVASADVVIENVKIKTFADTENAALTNQIITANYYNLKIGRNVVAHEGRKYVLSSVVGGNSDSSVAFNSSNHGKVIVESGSYYTLNTYNRSVTRSAGDHMIMQYGSDYDRVSGNNEKLIVDRRVGATSNSLDIQINDSITPSSEIIVKSGTYGQSIISSGGSTEDLGAIAYQEYGVSAGGMSNSITALQTLKIEGGRIFSVYGGLVGKNGNSVKISITGGHIDNVVGGSAASDTGGNRIVAITGGIVNNSVAGGSNGYKAASDVSRNETNLDGDTLIYIGGEAHIGGTPTIIDSRPAEENGQVSGMLFAVSKRGSIFGSSLSNARIADTKMTVNNSNIIINGGTIDGDVYGGGNYGATGIKTNGVSTTNINIYKGDIAGNVYGGSNKNGFAKSDYKDSSSININMYGGTV